MKQIDPRMAEIAERHGRATKGPWIRFGVRHKVQNEDCIAAGPQDGMLFYTSIGYEGRQQAAAIRDMDFIAHSWADIPWLLASLQAAQAEVERLRSELQEVDVLLAEYGIDTVGTGSSPGLKEEKRVLAILEKVTARLAAAREREA